MAIQSINSSIEKRNHPSAQKTRPNNNIAFTGSPNIIVGLMDTIEKGGFAASFIIQDGLGFIAPRVGKGVLRGSEQRDENGNIILDKHGKPKRDYNWEYARKEGVREIVTGPSAFLIPLGMLAIIKKACGSANNVKLNYIDGFKSPFTEFAKGNFEAFKSGTPNKADFYEKVFTNVIDRTINGDLPEGQRIMSPDEIKTTAKEFALKQVQTEEIKADKTITKKARKAKLEELGSVEADFMKLKKSKIGGTVNELSIKIKSSNGKLQNGVISEMLTAMEDYFGDAVKSTKKAIKENTTADHLDDILKSFTNKKMGSRILTNFGIFSLVAAFYTQIPKLYNLGLKGNPGLKGTVAKQAQAQQTKQNNQNENTTQKAADTTSFTGAAALIEKTGSKVFNNKSAKSISDIFELNGPVISNTAMTALLYGFCIPPRLEHAQDKYDYSEIVVRDLTSFTALLFGAKALARLFSDGFTRLTGLALNKKDMEGRNVLQKIGDYLNPNDTHHSVLTSKQLTSKYTNIEDYKGGVNGFIEFIENSGGNIKKAFNKDNKIKAAVDKIVNQYTGKSFKEATVDEIKQALKTANKEKTELIENFYKLFDKNNGLLKQARTYNSTFGFLSTIFFVPGLIIWLTTICENMTKRRTAKDFAANNINTENDNNIQDIKEQAVPTRIASEKISMAGFLNK